MFNPGILILLAHFLIIEVLRKIKLMELKMNLLLYLPVSKESDRLLYKLIENFVLEDGLEIHRAFENFSKRLRQPAKELIMAIVFAADRNDLSDIISIRDLLCDIRIMLILPDREEGTIALGHTLRPRFLTYADSDFGEVIAVLANILKDGQGSLKSTHLERRWQG